MSEDEIRTGLFAPAGEGEETAEIYRREARAIYESDRQAAASLLLDAAYANDRDDNPAEVIVRDLKLAIALCPNTSWIYASAHRLMLKLNLWREALSLIQCEIALDNAPDENVALNLTAAELCWIVGDDPASAMEYVQRALAIDANCVGALYAGLWLSNIQAQKTFAEALAKILGAPAERSVLYGLAGSIQAASGCDAQALECYTQAVQADRSNPYVTLRYAVLNERFGKLWEAAQAYAQAAQIFEDGFLSGELYRRAGSILEYIGQPERSAYFLSEAQKHIHDKYSVTWLACDAFHRTRNVQRVIEFERQLIQMASDNESKAAHWLAIADICLDELNAQNIAIEALEAASSLGFSNIADPRLAAIYLANEDWPKYAAVLKRIVQNESWDGMSWLLGNALWMGGEINEAIDIFSKLTGALGKFSLEQAYEHTENHEAHARMLENWIQASNDTATQDALLSQLLTILTERLNAPEIAIQYIGEVKQTRISRDIAWKRLHLARSLSRHKDVVAGLLQLATETLDKEESLMWQMEAALIQDRMLHDIESAIQTLKNIHEASPVYMPAVILLHEIGLRERRFDLIMQANIWRDAFLIATSKRAENARENAWACLHMNDSEGAVTWFEKARKLEPLNAYYLRIYINLLCSMSRWSDAVQVIEDTLKAAYNAEMQNKELSADDDTDENAILPDMQAAAILSESLGSEALTLRDMMLDIQTFCLNHPTELGMNREQLFAHQPTLTHAVAYLLEKCATDTPTSVQAALNEIRIHLEGASDEVRALIDWIEAEIIRMRQTDSANTKTASTILNLLRKSLDLKYGACLRTEVLRTLRELPQEDITHWLERYATLTPDKWMAMSLSREAALRSIWVDEDYETARRVLSQALVREDTDRRTLWMLEHFSAISEDWTALGVFRERLAQIEIAPQARLQSLKCALAPYVDANLTEHAVRIAQECLKLDGHAFPALVTLAHVAEDNGDLQSLACIADRLSEASAYSENRTEYGLWAAQIWSDSLSKPDQAIASLARLLAQEPACLPAIAMSEQLYQSLRRYEQLGRIYNRAITALPEGKEQIDLLKKQAHLLSEKLHDAPAACLSLMRIIKQDPVDNEALNLLADLLIAQSRWSEAVDIIEQLARVAESPEQKRSTNLKLAEILIHQLDQPDRAKRILRRHLIEFEHDMTALQLLYDIACTERNWADAKTTLSEICQAEGTMEARHARIAFTRVAREAGWSHDIRTMYEREAIAAIIGHRDDFDELIKDYGKHHEIRRLIDVAQRELGQLGNTDQIAQYRGCVAALLVANEQYREALAFLSEIIHDSQHTDWAYLARAQALTSAGQLDSAIGEFRRTLARNRHLMDAFEPFIEVLKQTGDEITLASVYALRELRQKGEVSGPWERCVKGSPRGYFDVDHMTLARNFVDAQRYLRTMTPYAFELFNDNIQLTPLDSTHWVFGRCHRLFGQNFEIKQAYKAQGLKQTLCRAKLQNDPALIFDESLLNEDDPIPFDFWASYAMHQAVTGGCVIDVLNDTNVEALFSALCQAKPESVLAQTMKRQLFRVLPRAERKLFKDGVPFLAPGWSEFRRALQTRAACAAAVISACPAYALKAHPNDEAFEVFLTSEAFVRQIKTYWTQGIGIAAHPI